MKNNSWMGLVLGDAGMAPGSDMIQIMANGVNSRVYDKFSQGYISPPEDSKDNINTESTFRFFDDDFIRFTLVRDLDTGDADKDFLIPVEQEFDLGWAVLTDSSNLLSKHSDAGGLRALILSDGTNSFGIGGAAPDGAEYLTHAATSSAILVTLLTLATL